MVGHGNGICSRVPFGKGVRHYAFRDKNIEISNIASYFAWSDTLTTVSKFVVYIDVNNLFHLLITRKTTNFEIVITVLNEAKGCAIFDDILNQRNHKWGAQHRNK